MGLFGNRQPQPVECFFCQSRAILGSRPGAYPPAKGTERNWLCPACECWNVRDASGQMVSYLPAMRERGLNGDSWEKRGEQFMIEKHTRSCSSRLEAAGCVSLSGFSFLGP